MALWPSRFLGLRGRIPKGHVCLSAVSVVCCQVEVIATGWPLVQRIPIECGVSECDRETSLMRGPCPIRGCRSKNIGNCPHLMGEVNPKYTAVPYTKIRRSGYACKL